MSSMRSTTQLKIIKELYDMGAVRVEIDSEGTVKVDFPQKADPAWLSNDASPQAAATGGLTDEALALYSA